MSSGLMGHLARMQTLHCSHLLGTDNAEFKAYDQEWFHMP